MWAANSAVCDLQLARLLTRDRRNEPNRNIARTLRRDNEGRAVDQIARAAISEITISIPVVDVGRLNQGEITVRPLTRGCSHSQRIDGYWSIARICQCHQLSSRTRPNHSGAEIEGRRRKNDCPRSGRVRDTCPLKANLVANGLVTVRIERDPRNL